jgi:type I restriction enzyme S subunit
MAGVSDTEGRIVEASERPLADVWKGYTHFAEGDVLFAKITPCMENGKSAIARDLRNGLGCGSIEFYVVRSNGAVLPGYVHLFLRQQTYRASARAAMTGAVGQLRVPKSFVENTILPLPPLQEQRRMVAKIEALRRVADGPSKPWTPSRPCSTATASPSSPPPSAAT